MNLPKPDRPLRIAVAVPCFNCGPQVARVICALAKIASHLEKIVIIDNRSQDNTLQVALEEVRKQRDQKFEVWQNFENLGLGGSHKVAFELAKKWDVDALAIVHGDAQADPHELVDLIETMIQSPTCAAVLGSRFMRGSRLHGYSRLRTIGNRALNLLYSTLTFRATKDLGSGLNLFSIRHMNTDLNAFSDGFTFNMDLLLDLYSRERQVAFTPISWHETDQISNARTFSVGWKSLKTLLSWRLGVRKQGFGKRSYDSRQLFPDLGPMSHHRPARIPIMECRKT